MDIVITLIFTLILLGVVFFYPLFFSTRNKTIKSITLPAYKKSTYEKELFQTFRAFVILIIVSIIIALIGTTVGVDFNRETYSMIIIVVTIMIIFL